MTILSRFKQAVIGRPKAIEGEQMVVAQGLMATAVRPTAGGVYFLPTDEILRRSGGYKTYKDMLNDDQVKACLEFKKILIAGRTWELKPANDTAQAKDIARFVTWALNEIGIEDAFDEALSALEFGFSVGEIVWTRSMWETKQVTNIEKIAHRDPEWLFLGRDDHGNFTGVMQRAWAFHGTATNEIVLGPEKVWLYTHNPRFGDIHGVSDLRSAYRSWWAKKFIINFWNVFLERMGQPMMIIHYPQGASEELKGVLKSILQNLASKTEVLVPEGVQASLLEATRGGNATYQEALSFHNNSIARSMLMVHLFGVDGDQADKIGSPSQSSIHLRVLFKMADKVSQRLVRTLMEQVIEPMVNMNFDNAEELMPKFVWQDFGQFEGMKVADTIRLLFAAGILDLDQADVNYARSVLGLPLRLEGDKEDKVNRPPVLPPPGNPNAPPPKAPAGNERNKKGGDTSSMRAPKQMALVLKEIEGEAPSTST